MQCYFPSLSIDTFRVLHLIFFEILVFVSEIVHFIHRVVVIVQSVWHSLLLRNNLFILARRMTAIVH